MLFGGDWVRAGEKETHNRRVRIFGYGTHAHSPRVKVRTSDVVSRSLLALLVREEDLLVRHIYPAADCVMLRDGEQKKAAEQPTQSSTWVSTVGHQSRTSLRQQALTNPSSRGFPNSATSSFGFLLPSASSLRLKKTASTLFSEVPTFSLALMAQRPLL